MIEISDLHFGYGATKVLNGISLCIRGGERVAILGGNGSGKSTLAAWLAGWFTDYQKSTGTVHWHARSWQSYTLSERVSTVQLVGQIPAQHLSGRAFTVAEEVAFGPENLGLPVQEVVQRRDHAIETCHLSHLADRDPFTLSGGEQQRLVIAAALALNPAVLILDEPFTNLDPESRANVASVLRDLPKEVIVILLDTSPDTALNLVDRFLLLHEGLIVADGDARAVLLHPTSIEILGLPAISQFFTEWQTSGVSSFAQVQPGDLPLTLEEAAAMLRRTEAC